MLGRMITWKWLGLIAVLLALGAAACTKEVIKEVPVEKIVTQEVAEVEST